MNVERWQKIQELYGLARERGAASALAGADPDRRREVEQLLAQSEGADGTRHTATDQVTQLGAGSHLVPTASRHASVRAAWERPTGATDTRLHRTVAI